MALNNPLPFVDSMNHYATGDIYTKWTVPVNFSGIGYAYFDTSSIESATGRCGANVIKITPDGSVIPGTGPQYTCAPASNHVFAGVAVLIHLFAVRCEIFRVQQGGTADGNNQIVVQVNTDGTLSAIAGYNHSTGGTLLGTTAMALSQDVFAFVELKSTIHGSAGTFEIWVNGVRWLDLTGQNTAPTGSNTWNGLQLGRIDGSAAAMYMRFGDLYLHDGTQAAPWNDRLGDIKVESRVASGDGTHQDWTPSPGPDHYTMIDEIPPDRDTTYIGATTPSKKDTYTFQALTITSGSIYGVQVCAMVRKDDAAFKQIDATTRVGGSDFVTGSPAAPSLGVYDYGLFMFLTNPNTASPWTVTTVNGAEFGVNVTT